MHIPAEFRLAAACCAWPPSPARTAAVRDAAAGADWGRLLKVAVRHRVEGLVRDALTRAGVAPPPEVDEALARAGRSTARDNLLLAAEAARAGAALDRAGIPYLVMKGAPLAMLAYGTLALKRAADIDIAVETERYGEAIALLRTLGFACEVPGPDASDAAIVNAAARDKHSLWVRGGLALELHSSLVDSPLLLPGLSVRSPRRAVAIGPGIVLPTLAGDELFAYLCVHGATHAWSRLKWIADVAALIAPADPAEIERLYRRSLALGGGRSAAQALLLCAALFGTELPAPLARELGRDRATRFLVATALRAMLSGDGETELDDLPLGTMRIHVSHFLLLPGWRFKLFELRRKLGGGGGVSGALLAGPRWLARRARTARARREPTA